MWRWVLLLIGLLAVLGGLSWLTRWMRSAPLEYVGVYAWDPDHPSTQTNLERQREGWLRLQGTLTQRDLLAGESLQIEPGPPRETLMVLVLMANGEAGMRPEPPHGPEYATGRWALDDEERVTVRLTEANGQELPEPYVLRGALREDRLHLTVTSGGVTEEQVFVKTSPTSECTCDDGQAGEPTWCWEHNRGWVDGVETDWWHCTFAAKRAAPCVACQTLLADRGRRALLDGRRDEARVCLARAYALGADDPNLRFLLVQAQGEVKAQRYEVFKGLAPHEPTWFGRGVVVLQTKPGRLVFMDAVRGQAPAEHRFEGEPPTIAIAPSGTHVAVSTGTSVRVIGLGEDGQSVSLALDDRPIVALAFSRTGDVLAGASETGAARLWSLDGRVLCTLPAVGKEVMDLAPDAAAGRVAVTYVDGTLVLWQCEQDAPTRVFERGKTFASDMAFLPQGHLAYAAAFNGTVTVLDGRTGEVRAEYTSPASEEGFGQLSPAWGGRRLLYAAGPATCVLDPTRMAEQTHRGSLPALGLMPEQQSWLGGSAVAPDGMRFATGDAEGVVRVWAADTLALLAAFPTQGGKLVSVAFAPDGDHLVAFTEGGRGYVWKTHLESRPPAAVEAEANAHSKWRVVGHELEPRDGR